MDQGILEDKANESPEAEMREGEPAGAPPEAQEGEQEVINQVKTAYPLMLNILAQDKIINSMIQDAKGNDPAGVIATVVAKLIEKVKQEVPDLKPEVMTAFGMLAIGEIADLFNQIGIEVTDGMKSEAAQAAVGLYMNMADDNTKAQIQQAAGDIQQADPSQQPQADPSQQPQADPSQQQAEGIM